MSILNEIIDYKKREVRNAKETIPIKRLEKSIFFNSPTVSMKHYLKRSDKTGIIAEIKRASPSAGIIQNGINVEKLSIAYMQSGASALSVLTDKIFFKGSEEDLKIARKFNYCPILRKDFIIDDYQVFETKSIGADCILLIASCITPEQCSSLSKTAKELDLEVLLEIHEKDQIIKYVNPNIDIIGVNNRDLKTFKTDIQNSLDLHEFLPKELIKISESGIESAEQLRTLKASGYDGFLIGGYFMQHEEPAKLCKDLITEYTAL